MKVHVYRTIVGGQSAFTAHFEGMVRGMQLSMRNIGEFAKRVREKVWTLRIDNPRERVLICFTPLADIVWEPGAQTPEEPAAPLTDTEQKIFTKIFIRSGEEAARMAGLNGV